MKTKKAKEYPSEPFAKGEVVKEEHVSNVQVCDEKDVMASIQSGGIEIQVMSIGVTVEREGCERVVYMRLETPFTIPFDNFEWEGSSDELKGK